jgi:hypothetical protein
MTDKAVPPLLVCPRCHWRGRAYPAVSRHDDKTEICPDCGVKEGLEAWHGDEYPFKPYWEVKDESQG